LDAGLHRDLVTGDLHIIQVDVTSKPPAGLSTIVATFINYFKGLSVNRLLYISFASFLILCSVGSGQEWIKAYGGAGVELGKFIEPTADGGFIVGGLQSETQFSDDRFWVARFDSSGAKLWDKDYGRDGETHTMFVFTKDRDGGAMFGGFTGIQFSGEESALMYRIDSAGKIVWDIDVDYDDSDHWHVLIERNEGGFYMGGHTDSKGDPRGDMWLQRLDSSRTLIWEKVFDRNTSEHSHSGIETREGGAVLLGHTEVGGYEKWWVVKADSNGAVQWQKVYTSDNYSPNYHDSPYKIFETRDGNYALIGGTSHPQLDQGTMWLLVVDTSGAIVLDKHYGSQGGSSFAWSGRQTSDGGYILAGYTNYQTHGLIDMYVVKTDAQGNIEWEKRFGGTGYDYGYDVIEVSDGYVVAGYTGSTSIMTGGGGDLMLVKIRKELPAPSTTVLLSPPDGSNDQLPALTTTWRPTATATGYHLQLSATQGFTSLIVSDSTLTSTSREVKGLIPGQRYWWRVRAANTSGWGPYSETWSFVVAEPSAGVNSRTIASSLKLYPNTPNPFSTTTAIRFSLAGNAHVDVKVLDLYGREVATVIDQQMASGEHRAIFNGAELTSGAYVYRITAKYSNGQQESRTQRMMLVR
jgi:hypothetical protein